MTRVDYLRIGLTVLQVALVVVQLVALRISSRERQRDANAITGAIRAATAERFSSAGNLT